MMVLLLLLHRAYHKDCSCGFLIVLVWFYLIPIHLTILSMVEWPYVFLVVHKLSVSMSVSDVGISSVVFVHVLTSPSLTMLRLTIPGLYRPRMIAVPFPSRIRSHRMFLYCLISS